MKRTSSTLPYKLLNYKIDFNFIKKRELLI